MTQANFAIASLQNDKCYMLPQACAMQQSQAVESKTQPQEVQLSADRLLRCEIAPAKPKEFICTTEAATSAQLPLLEPNALLEKGGITAAIILSIAFLILALAEYNKVFVPVMLQKLEEKERLNNPLE